MATATLPAGSSNSSDNVVVHPYLFPHAALKTAAFSNKNKVQKQLDAVVITGDKALSKEAASYIGELASARTVLNTALESASVSDTAVTDAAATYLSLLVGLVTANSSSNGAAAAAASPDEALSAAEQGSSSCLDLTAPPSKLRAAVRFEWNDVLVSPAAGATPRTSAAADSLFELASVLVATGVRLMHAAAAACADSATGVTTPASTRAYQLLRQASGMLDFASGQVMPWLPLDTPSRDLDPHLVRGLSRLALADAQQLTVLRAVAKGNQPALIASLATDTASQYRQACSQLSSSPLAEVHSCKLWQYGQYKQAYCTAYAHCFNGVALCGKDSCGAALKSLEAAAAALSAAKQASSGYDAAPPASLNLHHRRTDEDLEHLIYKNQQRLKRDNDKVFLQPIPSEVPPLPEGTCLVSALPYSLPQPAAAVKEGVVERCFVAGPPPPAAPTQAAVAAGVDGAAVAAGAGAGADAAGKGSAPVGASAPGGAAQPGGKGEEAEQQGCSCCRVVVVAICSPILALLWLLGALIWILLLPLKCCFPCCGFPLQWGADAVLWLMRAPARGLMYATGKKEKREGGPEVKK